MKVKEKLDSIEESAERVVRAPPPKKRKRICGVCWKQERVHSQYLASNFSRRSRFSSSTHDSFHDSRTRQLSLQFQQLLDRLLMSVVRSLHFLSHYASAHFISHVL